MRDVFRTAAEMWTRRVSCTSAARSVGKHADERREAGSTVSMSAESVVYGLRWCRWWMWRGKEGADNRRKQSCRTRSEGFQEAQRVLDARVARWAILNQSAERMPSRDRRR